jgi:hypothetical protein
LIAEGPPEETTMRLLLAVLSICVGLVGMGKSAEAQNYPWCAHYGTGFGGINWIPAMIDMYHSPCRIRQSQRVHNIPTMHGHRECISAY